MSDAPDDDRQHRRPHSQPMAAAFLEFDLMRELEQLHGEPEWSSGQNARTLVKFDDFRIVLMTLRAGAGARASDEGSHIDPNRGRPRPGAGGRSDIRSPDWSALRIGPRPVSRCWPSKTVRFS